MAPPSRWPYVFGKYAYYDAVCEIATLNMVRSDAYYISRQTSKSLVFNPLAKKSTLKYDDVFGGSSKHAKKSSRRDVSYRDNHRLIAGVSVPQRPIEPDNCCMSGCINCVWELFNEDMEEWKHKRTEAAKALMAKGEGKWPKDWDAPPKILDSKYIHGSHDENPEEVSGMPVGLRVFMNFENKKKAKSQKKRQPDGDALSS